MEGRCWKRPTYVHGCALEISEGPRNFLAIVVEYRLIYLSAQ